MFFDHLTEGAPAGQLLEKCFQMRRQFVVNLFGITNHRGVKGEIAIGDANTRQCIVSIRDVAEWRLKERSD